MRKLMLRVLAAVPPVALQVLWLLALLKWLAPWAAVVNVVLSVLALLFVLYLISKQEEPTYKVLWLLVILTFPLPGALLYLLFGGKRSARSLRARLDKVDQAQRSSAGSLPMEADSRLRQTFGYLQQLTGGAVYPNTGAKFYPLGDAMFPDLLKALEEAEHYIFLEYFIVDHGVFWDSVVEILQRKASQGVDVRVMYDDLGSISTYTPKDAWQLQHSGIRCVAFNPLVFIKGTLNYRDHRKMTVIDGRVAFTGGVNMADEYINRVEKYGHWKDFGLRLEGAAAHSYTRMFAQFWNAFSNDPIPQQLLQAPDWPVDAAPDGYVLSYGDSPLADTAASNELYIELLSQAREYAYFFTPYLMLGDSLLEAFVRAARRGVDVRIIMPGVPDKKLVFRMSHSFYPILLKAGVKIYEYIPGFVHAKGCVVDDRVGTVGTVNLDYRSLFLHFENNALFWNASVLGEVKADFLATQRQCRTMQLGENVPTGFVHWLVDGVLRIVSPLC